MKSSLLEDIGGQINIVLRKVLDNPKASFTSKQTCIDLSARRPDGFDIEALVLKLYEQIERHRKPAASRIPSSKNWELRWQLEGGPDEKPRKVRFDDKNPSAEVVLERLIVEAVLNSNCHRDDWFHQCPSASGVFSANGERCHIDLIHQINVEEFELIELKVTSYPPVFAAFEILRNGLFYLHARRSLMKDPLMGHYADKRLLKARKIRLTVLAPWDYYKYKPGRGAELKMYDLGWFEKALDRGISAFGRNDCEITFAFDAFPRCFEWKKERATPEQLLAAVNGRQAAFVE